MKQLYTTSNEVDLQMLVGLLESQGIVSQTIADGAGGYFRTLGADYAITKSILVNDNDWDRAVQLAKENGFVNQKAEPRSRTEVIGARIVLVILVIIFVIFFFL